MAVAACFAACTSWCIKDAVMSHSTHALTCGCGSSCPAQLLQSSGGPGSWPAGAEHASDAASVAKCKADAAATNRVTAAVLRRQRGRGQATAAAANPRMSTQVTGPAVSGGDISGCLVPVDPGNVAEALFRATGTKRSVPRR